MKYRVTATTNGEGGVTAGYAGSPTSSPTTGGGGGATSSNDVAANVQLPFRVHAVVNEASKTRVEYKVVVRSMYPHKIYGQNVVIRVPTPTNTSNARISVTGGKAKYVGSENCIVWK